MKRISCIIAILLGLAFVSVPQEAEASGLLGRLLLGQRQQVVVVDNRGRVIRRDFRSQRNNFRFRNDFRFRQRFVLPQRRTRIVEVPNLEQRRDLIVTRDRFGRVIDVRRRDSLNIRRFEQRKQQQRRVIVIEQDIRRRY